MQVKRRGAEGHTYGEVARRFAIKAGTTADDSRIERLMGETYGYGYFSLDELRRACAKRRASQVACPRQSVLKLTV